MRMQIQPLKDGTTEVDIKLLDDGRACIHWLQECDDGPIELRGVAELRKVMGRPEVGRYRVACNPSQNTVNSQKRGNVRYICMTSGDIAAVTCPVCMVLAPQQVESKDEQAAQAAMDCIRQIDQEASALAPRR